MKKRSTSSHFRRVAYDVMIALIGNTLLYAGRSIALSIVIWASLLFNNEIASEPMGYGVLIAEKFPSQTTTHI